MSWVSFISGGMVVIFVYALFSPVWEEEIVNDLQENDEIEVHDFQTRYVTLSCQTCRKLKKHKEVKPNLFQCMKCKRHVDLRAS